MPEYLFVTGRLAAPGLHATLRRLEPDFDYVVEVLDISVAGLMRADWVARHLTDNHNCSKIMLPGLCRGDLSLVEEKVGTPVIRGPKDHKDLAGFFGKPTSLEGYGDYRVRILAEIVDAYQMPWEEILTQAEYFRRAGADIIDLGCPPSGGFDAVADVVAGLKERGFLVSVDTFDADTMRAADSSGVDLLLSVNSNNLAVVKELRCKVCVVPDFGQGLESLERNVARVAALGASYVIDPVLNPLNFGFAESLQRYLEVRGAHPDDEILMGVGNVTELTDADSTGINALMAGVVAELKIDYILTTEVISWARGSVRELDKARRLMHYAAENQILPKSIDDSLVALKDTPFEPYSETELREIQKLVRDRNLRIFTDRQSIFVFNRDCFVKGSEPDRLFEELGAASSKQAFYLGRELERAALAIRLGKRYTQDSGLRWGYLSEQVDDA